MADGYVDVKTAVQPQQTVELAKLAVPQTVSLVDKDATPETARVYAYMKGIAASDQVLYGHQNEMNRKVSKLPGASDTYDIVKDFSGVVGMDGLALTGNELKLTEAERANGETYATKLARLVLPATKKGAILTMSCHMPNFALMENMITQATRRTTQAAASCSASCRAATSTQFMTVTSTWSQIFSASCRKNMCP